MDDSSNSCIAVIAHAGARQTIADFMPRWRWFDIPIVGLLPEGDDWPHEDKPDLLFHAGVSAHRGPDAFRRFHASLKILLERTDFNVFTILEPDCVPLKREMPKLYSDAFCGWICTVPEKDAFPYAILPPYIVERHVLQLAVNRLCDHMNESHPDCQDLTDRWLCKALNASKIPSAVTPNTYGWARHNHIGKTLKMLGIAWAHGFKNNEEMKKYYGNEDNCPLA